MIILIPYNTTLQTNMAPEGLLNIIDNEKWNMIATSINKSVSEGTCLTFATELGICVCTGFFCIFGCHICINNMIIQNRLNDCLNRLNSTVFYSQNVLCIQGNSIAINTDVIRENLFSPTSNIQYTSTFSANNNFNYNQSMVHSTNSFSYSQSTVSNNFSDTQPTTNNFSYTQPISNNFSYIQPTAPNDFNCSQPTAPIYNQNFAQIYPINTNVEMLYPDNNQAFYPEVTTVILNSTDIQQTNVYNKF